MHSVREMTCLHKADLFICNNFDLLDLISGHSILKERTHIYIWTDPHVTWYAVIHGVFTLKKELFFIKTASSRIDSQLQY